MKEPVNLRGEKSVTCQDMLIRDVSQRSVVASMIFIVSNLSVLNLFTIVRFLVNNFTIFIQILIFMIKTILKCEYESLLSQNLAFEIKCTSKMPNQGVTLV